MRNYWRVIVIVEGFLLACPLLTFGRAIDKYRLAYTLWIHKPTPTYFLVMAISHDEYL